MNTEEEQYFYNKGYYEGFIKGQQKAVDIICEYEKNRLQPLPILIIEDYELDEEKNREFKHTDMLFLKTKKE